MKLMRLLVFLANLIKVNYVFSHRLANESLMKQEVIFVLHNQETKGPDLQRSRADWRHSSSKQRSKKGSYSLIIKFRISLLSVIRVLPWLPTETIVITPRTEIKPCRIWTRRAHRGKSKNVTCKCEIKIKMTQPFSKRGGLKKRNSQLLKALHPKWRHLICLFVKIPAHFIYSSCSRVA